MSLIIRVLVRSSATMRPRGDRKLFSWLLVPLPPLLPLLPMPLASVSALKMAAALW
ncbi:hypothetical protein D3C78_1945750 [compost metagenome]